MPILFVLALAAVYVLGVAGVVFAGSIVGPERGSSQSLEERLALVRTTEDARRDAPPDERVPARPRRRANASRSRPRVVESIVRAFTPVLDQRMRSDVAASRSVRPARSD